MNILLVGIGGKMGAEVLNLSNSGYKDIKVVAGVETFGEFVSTIPVSKSFEEAEKKVDCILDFSNHNNTISLLNFAVNNNLPLVIATTGQTESEKQAIMKASEKIPVFFASNYSMGIALLIESAKNIVKGMPSAEIEIVETHHDRKIDAPSGTALTIANEIKEVKEGSFISTGRKGESKRDKNEIGIQSIRIGNVFGIHEVIIATESEIITLKHEALNRKLFAEGSFSAINFIKDKPAGLYKMKDLIKG